MGNLAAWSPRSNEPPPRLNEVGPTVWKRGLPIAKQGVKVVGTPIGSEEYLQEMGRQLVGEGAQLLEQIPKLASLQASCLILCFCAAPRVNHLLHTLAPQQGLTIGRLHDERVADVFRRLFGISSEDCWLRSIKQATLPLRLAGCGLRDSQCTAHAAYWASWADSLGAISERFPEVGQRMLTEFEHTSREDGAVGGLLCFSAAEQAGRRCDDGGWRARPSRIQLAAGIRPPQPSTNEQASLGEWAHGWQFHAGNVLEQKAWNELLRELALPSQRTNAHCG